MRNAFVCMLAACVIAIVRLFVPTVGHSWPMVFIAVAHIWVGVMLTLLWQRKGKWALGWFCLGVPTLLEAVMFAVFAGPPQ